MRRTKLLPSLFVLTLLACNGESPIAVSNLPGGTINMTVGQELDITLGNVGPGQYDTIPGTASPVVRFVGVTFVTPAVPAGPTQRFQYVAQSAGRAVITLGQSGRPSGLPSDTVLYTVVVH